jgi:hypothetical protein
MSQYFKLVNVDKKEVVTPWDIGGAKFWEWLYNPHARVVVWLLRQSDGDGGGDISLKERSRYTTLGRWAGDRVTLVGDYDSSKLWQESDTTDAEGRPLPDAPYTDITATLWKEFNEAVERDGGTEFL